MGLFDRIKGVLDDVRGARPGTRTRHRTPEAEPAPSSSPHTPDQVTRYATVTVQPGQTLAGIAEERGVDLQEMVRLNGIEAPDLVFPGQVFKLPPA
ncbi:LysM peptidoglycan-binding domain-containing protein [Serinicoccus kebangsaanensis]|uniref:LysM peptidoglycan-binding domain-containing protein n=1 Tax=Serinicoccus kebangsaanensis TaxID=2602069 RepID=UPI00124E0FF7|nr:LysM domain-containing protein [Serinicoccus kebangsaanensis]